MEKLDDGVGLLKEAADILLAEGYAPSRISPAAFIYTRDGSHSLDFPMDGRKFSEWIKDEASAKGVVGVSYLATGKVTLSFENEEEETYEALILVTSHVMLPQHSQSVQLWTDEGPSGWMDLEPGSLPSDMPILFSN